jgi:hypothetical protein
MTLAWGPWRPLPKDATSPYVDWWLACPPPEFSVGSGAEVRFTAPLKAGAAPALLGATPGAGIVSDLDEDFGDFRAGQGPLPKAAHNDAFEAHFEANGWQAAPADLPRVASDTVIVGIVDSGVALGHSRFRRADGKTRVLAAWQQDAPHRGQPYLPFGHELYQKDIDRLIGRHTTDGPSPQLVEEDFNRAAALVDFTDPLRGRDLAGRASHGTFVADIAAGASPDLADERIGLMVVNVPNRATINNSGVFLDYFSLYAIIRIADLADQLWQKSTGGTVGSDGVRGFPIVVNLSFGKNAGSKDGDDYFASAIHRLNAERLEAGRSKVQVVIPVGNHNLEQGNAELRVAPGSSAGIGLRILPEDQSSNYLEIWSDWLPNPDRKAARMVENPIAVAITPPGGTGVAPAAGAHRQVRSFRNGNGGPDTARLYCGVKMAADRLSYRIWYVFAAAPTIDHVGIDRGCPAGRWEITVASTLAGGMPTRVFLGVQTDQSTRPYARTGLLPRLVHPDYERYRADGRLRDSHAYPFAKGMGDDETSAILRRHGSINATAASSAVIAIAGYRRSDGRPAVYSATGAHPDAPPVGKGRVAPTVSCVTDDGYAQYGILGAGSMSGGVVAMRGTSFAAAQATRLISQRMKDGVPADFDAEAWLHGEGKAAERQVKACYPGTQPPKAKIGSGRLPAIRTRPVSRYD